MAWLSGWAKRIPLTIDHTKIAADLTGFPVPVKITAAAVFTELSSDANRLKIAITAADGTTQQYVEIERWDHANSVAWLHVGPFALSSSTDTVLYLYYDSAHADNTTYVGDTGSAVARSVWDSDFIGVWHMSQDPSTGGACILNSTSAGNNATPAGSMTSGDLVDGKFGKGLDYDGSDDALSVASDASLDVTTAMTIECVQTPVYPASANFPIVVIKAPVNGVWLLLQDAYGVYGLNKYVFYLGSATAAVVSTSTWSDGAARHIVATYDKVNTRLLINGVQEAENSSYDGNIPTSSSPLYLGYPPANQTKGVLDEVRFSKIARSAAWVKATYHGLWDTLLALGAEETPISDEGTWLEDVSLDLSAYYQSLEDVGAWLRAHDGIELEDLQAALAAWGQSLDDLPSELAAYYQDILDAGLDLSAYKTVLDDLAMFLWSRGDDKIDMPTALTAAKHTMLDCLLYLEAVTGLALIDLGAWLEATDGQISVDCKLDLAAIASAPSFRSVCAQRLSSIISEAIPVLVLLNVSTWLQATDGQVALDCGLDLTAIAA